MRSFQTVGSLPLMLLIFLIILVLKEGVSTNEYHSLFFTSSSKCPCCTFSRILAVYLVFYTSGSFINSVTVLSTSPSSHTNIVPP